MISREQVIEYLKYDPESGVFHWRKRSGHAMPGSIAGSVGKNGYRYICINRRKYLAHRLAFLILHGRFPSQDVDHATCNRDDNRASTIRAASRSLNMRNVPAFKNNRSGFKGVVYDKGRGLYRATISLNGKQTHLGRFATPEAAATAYGNAAKQHFGEFAFRARLA